MIDVIGVLMQTVWASVPTAEVKVIVLAANTVMVPLDVMLPHPPVNVIVKVVIGCAVVGVPLMVTTLATQLPVTPVGNPLKVAPVALVVLYMMGVMAVLIHISWLRVPNAEERVIVLFGVTVIVPVVLITPQPPVRVTV